MLLEIVFALYALLLVILTIVLGFNFVRIGTQLSLNPRIFTILLPLLINFVLANTVFRQIGPLFSTLLPCLICFFLSRKLQNVRIFGLTGGIATGKTTLVNLIKTHLKHVSIIDCDQISRSLSNKGQPGYQLIIKLLGEKSDQYVNSVSKQIEREKFANFVFLNKEFREKLTAKMGQIIISKVFKTIIINIVKGKNVMLIDAPLLYETKILEYICYPITVVGCSKQLQFERLCKRNNLTEKEAKSRIQSQMPLEEKKRKCQIYLDNCKSQQSLLNDFLTKIKPFMQKNFSKASKPHKK